MSCENVQKVFREWTFLFWSLTSNYYRWKFFLLAGNGFQFHCFCCCINFRFRANNFLFYRFVYWYITTYWYFAQYQFAVCPLWIDIPSAHVYRIRMCLIKVNQVETSLESISQRFYWAFSPSNVDTYFHCFQILVRTKIMELSLAGCRS